MRRDTSQGTGFFGSEPSDTGRQATSGSVRTHFATALMIIGLMVLLGIAIMTYYDKYSNIVIAEDPSGVRIVLFRYVENIPNKWQQPPIEIKFAPTTREEATARLDIVHAALAKYPDGFVRTYAKQICMIQGLTFSGLRASGTRYDDTVYLGTREPIGSPLTDEELDRLLHHELSGLILRGLIEDFPVAEWMLLNPANFRYPRSIPEGLKSGMADRFAEPALFSSGFYCRYQQLSFEEDVNVVASHVMCPAMEFQAAVTSSQRLRGKVTLWLQFLRKHGGLRAEYEQMWNAYAPLPPV